MSNRYDATYLRQFYDDYGAREWDRLQANPEQLVNFHIHRELLRRYIKAGDRILEAGAGPGRFTIELARLGARVTVGDISPAQLELNRVKVAEAGCEHQVDARELLDIADLSRYPTGTFDATVCYGGPLSYLFEQADTALAELLRVTRPGGFVLLSVMSLVGSTRPLPLIFDLVRKYGLDAVQAVINTGDLVGDMTNGHRCHMFTWTELKALLERHGCTIEAAAASGCLSLGQADTLRAVLEQEPDLWRRYLDWELHFCQQPGAIDCGTHMVAVVSRGR